MTRPVSSPATPRSASCAASLCPQSRRRAGFGLVEIMVAMVIGMLGIIVMMQMFGLFEAQKRTTTGGDDAISSGSIALYAVKRDVQQSGWGITTLPLIGCNVSGLLASGAVLRLVPVTINPAGISGDPNTDTLLIVSGNGNGTVEGDNIDSQVVANAYAVHAPSAFVAGDRVVAEPSARPAPCILASSTVVSVAPPNPNVNVTASVPGMTAGRLYNLGAAPRARVYAVRNGNLTVCDYLANDCAADVSALTVAQLAALWVPIADNVVSLRAEYGRDSNALAMDGIADVWDRSVATPTTVPPVSSDAAKNTEGCGLLRVSALRIAIVARSSQPEPAPGGVHVTATVPVWAGSDSIADGINHALATAAAFSLPDPDPAWPTWQDYRYKVFETVVPLRNVTSLGVVDGC